MTGLLLDLCREHCLSPNLSKGKTEIQFSFRGAGSRRHKVQLCGPNVPPTLAVMGEEGMYQVPLVQCYKHLGGLSHHTGEQNAELSQRAAIAHRALNQHRRVLYQNKGIKLEKRAELFTMLVLSKCLCGAESWITNNDKVANKFHAMIINLYKRLLQVPKDAPYTDEDVLVAVSLPSPEELLRRSRQRYFATLVHSELPDLWASIGRDDSWCRLLEEDIVWMWNQLHHASNLPDPRLQFASWLSLVQMSPGYWKRLVRRACLHCVLQRQRLHQVRDLHVRILHRLLPFIADDGAFKAAEDPSDHNHFGCMICQRRCRNAAGEAAHMCKVHGRVSSLRFLCDHPTCGACLKHFHTMAKLKAHLYYSTRCRQTLQSRNHRCAVVSGTGSFQDRALASLAWVWTAFATSPASTGSWH